MWKVFEETGGNPHFLYHGLGGSKRIPLDTWLDAEVKWVSEGSNPYYWSGFHCYLSLESIAAWKHRTRKNQDRVAVEITTGPTEKKPTRGEAWLAHRMIITAEQWTKRIPLSEI